MLKKVLATAAVAASVVGVSGTVAAPAMAVGDEHGGQESVTGNGAMEMYGNTTTGGKMSPNMALVNGSLNNVCLGVPVNKANVGSLVGLVPITVQDILTSANNQNCADNSTQIDGDDPLSHLIEDIPILSENGANTAS
ncbi:RdlA protein [Streptomyces armeniacus]|uniref:RdlA protein n=1 Tax=Streptomyces armeniacus TaxID=83291 RepID=A0A345XXN6_9ACTN|nr:rodlin [Streptomyces armeniacus]AXK36402.1 RdlA protein [Streptomyces armeniacus]